MCFTIFHVYLSVEGGVINYLEAGCTFFFYSFTVFAASWYNTIGLKAVKWRMKLKIGIMLFRAMNSKVVEICAFIWITCYQALGSVSISKILMDFWIQVFSVTKWWLLDFSSVQGEKQKIRLRSLHKLRSERKFQAASENGFGVSSYLPDL